jgi:hypothetical protein
MKTEFARSLRAPLAATGIPSAIAKQQNLWPVTPAGNNSRRDDRQLACTFVRQKIFDGRTSVILADRGRKTCSQSLPG